MIEEDTVIKLDDDKEYYVLDSLMSDNNNFIMIGEIDSVKDEITAMFTSYFKIGDYDFGKECSVTDLEAMVKENCDGVKSIRMSATSSISQEGDMVIYPAVSQILTLGTLNFEMTGGIADE